MKKLNLLFFCSVLLLACDDNGVTDNGADYLPLEIGNEWKFTPVGNTYGEVYRFKRVIDKVTLNNHEYYAVVSGTAVVEETISDTTYYRIDWNGFVYVLPPWQSTEENLYRLAASDGDTWTYSVGVNMVSISASITTLDLASKSLNDCKSFYYDVKSMVDEEHRTTFAKGIGFADETTRMGVAILKSAIIDGHEIHF